jgi:hypothetical protein
VIRFPQPGCVWSNRLVLAQVAAVVECAGLQIGVVSANLGEGGLAENIGGDVLDRGLIDLMNEADVPVFT